MAKIAIVFEYEPKLEHYVNCDTIEECVASDVEALNAGEMDPADMLSVYDWNAQVAQ